MTKGLGVITDQLERDLRRGARRLARERRCLAVAAGVEQYADEAASRPSRVLGEIRAKCGFGFGVTARFEVAECFVEIGRANLRGRRGVAAQRRLVRGMTGRRRAA